MNRSLFSPKPYEELVSYQRSLVVYLATVEFCRRFMDPRDRTVDQMIQAARSGKQNIVEGSMAAVTSTGTEIKLTGVALASLAELKEDYKDYLLTHAAPFGNGIPARRCSSADCAAGNRSAMKTPINSLWKAAKPTSSPTS